MKKKPVIKRNQKPKLNRVEIEGIENLLTEDPKPIGGGGGGGAPKPKP